MKEQFRYVMYIICAMFVGFGAIDIFRVNFFWAALSLISALAVYGIIQENKDGFGLFVIVMVIQLFMCFFGLDMLGIIKFLIISGLVLYYVYLNNNAFKVFK